MKRWFIELIKSILGVFAKLLSLFSKRLAWDLAQWGELTWHKKDKWRQSEDFVKSNHELFTHFGFGPDDYNNMTLIDLGAGSMLRSKYFKGAKIVAIEPLADKYLHNISSSDLHDSFKLYSIPAEQDLIELHESADFVMSINVIDHCYEFDKIIENVFGYLKPGKLAFLSFDSHEVADFMHPLVLTKNICSSKFTKLGFDIEKITETIGTESESYGHGRALNFWLRKPLERNS